MTALAISCDNECHFLPVHVPCDACNASIGFTDSLHQAMEANGTQFAVFLHTQMTKARKIAHPGLLVTLDGNSNVFLASGLYAVRRTRPSSRTSPADSRRAAALRSQH